MCFLKFLIRDLEPILILSTKSSFIGLKFCFGNAIVLELAQPVFQDWLQIGQIARLQKRKESKTLINLIRLDRHSDMMTIHRWGSRVSGKIAWGGPPILHFIAFLLTSFSKICLGGCCFIPPLPPVCIYELMKLQ